MEKVNVLVLLFEIYIEYNYIYMYLVCKDHDLFSPGVLGLA